MRALIVIPLALLVTAAAVWTACAAAGWTVEVRPMLLAAGICLLSASASLVPLLLTRGATQDRVAPAGLVGTVAHLFLTTALAAPMFLSRLHQPQSFTYWLFAFYWVSLGVLVFEFVRAVRSAPVQSAGPGNRE